MASPATDLGRVRITPYGALRIVLGLILLSAAVLKGHQLATEPVAETGLLTSRWFLIGVVEFELLFSLWLFFGAYPRRTWQAAVLCFSGFACISLYKVLSGEATCGCFGRVPVNPWYTLILDLGAVAALCCCRPARHPQTSPLPPAGEGPGARARPATRLGWVWGLFLASGIPAAFLMGSYRPGALAESGDVFGDSEFVVLEPETWVGKRFPLLKYIDIGDELAEGRWVVVLYHHECPNCEELIADYQHLWRAGATASSASQVALIEMPPYGDKPFSFEASWRRGQLSEVEKWFAATPIECALRDGSVSKVRMGGI